MDTPPSSDRRPRVRLEGSETLIDQPVSGRLTGLDPGELVRVLARATDAEGTPYASWVKFRAGGDGEVDLASDAPVDGTYQGIDPFGLWWSMRSEPNRGFASGIDPVPTTLIAERDGREIARKQVLRRWVGHGVSVRPVAEEGLVARLFSPAVGPSPGVVVFGGSGGGFHASLETAALLASHGFAALAVAYFGLPGLPAALVDIPVEYFERALLWMLDRPQVHGDRVALVGGSRGGELALLLASMCSEVAAVVAHAPSALLWGGFDPARARPGAAWTRGGRPLACMAFDPLRARRIAMNGGTMPDVYLDALQDAAAVSRAATPVERIRGAVLLISGGDDQMWPSGHFAGMVMDRLGGPGDRHRHLHYPGAGHFAGKPPGVPASDGFAVHPVDGAVRKTGGTMAANAASSIDAWPQVLDFLHRELSA
ncbi:MAG: acyl-CoA thioesterase/bile acid-CoA:amino acid N-acyltransferase family protein [Candidatus Dormibacteria bacterium]